MNSTVTSDSIADKFSALKEMNAGCLKIVPRNADESPMAAAIFLGASESAQVLPIIDRLEESWENRHTFNPIPFVEWCAELRRCALLNGTKVEHLSQIDVEAYRCYYNDGMLPVETWIEDLSNA